MCNYSITNKVFISEKGPRRSFDTGPTQNYLRQCVETSHGLRSWRHPHATKNLAFESWRFVMCSPSVWKFEEWDASSGLVIGRIFCLLVFLQNVTSILFFPIILMVWPARNAFFVYVVRLEKKGEYPWLTSSLCVTCVRMPLIHGGTLNNCRAAKPLVRWVEREEACDHPQGVLPQNLDGTEPHHKVTCMVFQSYV
ncbi:hypothetical protein TNCV_4415822 [Trichonephila clavipes]|uniref:Uncharacterized protein n=1 Tax=Trichonephila clavipes TaxID=2585209 RepID=A0A8X6VEI1_TRICX|nr:hypothetical protein TNCV_4415822 [Trichonephila clavipes]